MATADDELQAAADRGELQAKNTSALKRQMETSDRRWIVMIVKEIAVAHSIKPDEFGDMCETIYKFICGASAAD